MAIRRDIESGDSGRTVTVVEDADPAVRGHAEGFAHTDDVRTTRPDSFTLARGWMRTFNLFLGSCCLSWSPCWPFGWRSSWVAPTLRTVS